MLELVQEFISNEDVFIPSVIAGSIVLVIAIKAVTGMFSRFAQERTRREIAAYIAEGSMSPEQGERLMQSGRGPRGCV